MHAQRYAAARDGASTFIYDTPERLYTRAFDVMKAPAQRRPRCRDVLAFVVAALRLRRHAAICLLHNIYADTPPRHKR